MFHVLTPKCLEYVIVLLSNDVRLKLLKYHEVCTSTITESLGGDPSIMIYVVR